MNSNFTLAKRENNPRRDFIIVNKFQSKHYPSDPRETASHCAFLGREMVKLCPSGRCLAVVFSETAVGIGALAASALGSRCTVISTTREELQFPNITVEETHSHAPLHRLCVRAELNFKSFEHVFMIDDEFTTGNTAISLYSALSEWCACPFTAVSFAASEESRRSFSAHGIGLISEEIFGEGELAQSARSFTADTVIVPKTPELDLSVNSIFDIRLGVSSKELFGECERLCNALSERLGEALADAETVEIIGTEELCLPPIILGLLLTEKGKTVRVHGITRSPMLPSAEEGYPIRERAALKSLYDPERRVFLYNRVPADLSIIMTDAENPDEDALRLTCGAAGGGKTALIRWRGRRMRISLDSADCRLLLKDVTGLIKPLPPSEREPLIRSGVHYCELLPAEHEPSEKYLAQYEAGLRTWGRQTAAAVRAVAEKILAEKGENVVLVSLARAGTPVGALVKRYLKRAHGIDVPHYSVSIIRGRGIDRNALRYILARHSPEKSDFWTAGRARALSRHSSPRRLPTIPRSISAWRCSPTLRGYAGYTARATIFSFPARA